MLRRMTADALRRKFVRREPSRSSGGSSRFFVLRAFDAEGSVEGEFSGAGEEDDEETRDEREVEFRSRSRPGGAMRSTFTFTREIATARFIVRRRAARTRRPCSTSRS